MALIVEQRPEEQLFVEDNPTIYDTPYYTSRFNAANLPLVYKISNTKFPVNTEDVIEDILSVSNNAGFAQLTLDAATYTFLAKGTVEITNTTSYNGVWSIRSVIDSNNIVINAPFVADETGNVQNYYNNYSTLVKVYSGLPEYHPLNSTKPMTLITDNPITVTPNSDNEAIVDVSALVKSKLSLNNEYDLNDVELFNAFYIEYSEQYDESDGNNVTVTTEAFQQDLIEGCEVGAANFVTNGDFATDLSDWSNVGGGVSWVFDTGTAAVTLSSSNSGSALLLQTSLGATKGVEYSLSFDYDMGANTVNVLVFNGNVIYEQELTGTGTVNIDFIASIANSISFGYVIKNTPSVGQVLRLDNVVIINKLTNPCLAYIFSSHSALQPQAKYGGNMGEYVQNFNGGVFANKWLTLMQEPVLFEGNYFDLSTLIPQAVVQSAIQAGGFFLQIIEFDRNGVVIEETEYPITQNLGDGIYRFRLDDKTFNNDTVEFTAQILRIPVNLFTDGDQGTFNNNITGITSDTESQIVRDTTLSFEGAASLRTRSYFDTTDSFIFTVETTSAGETFTLPLINGGLYDFVVDWGDGNVENITAFDQPEVTHTYASASTHTISMNGVINGYAFQNTGDKLKIRTISQWGKINFGRASFFGCSNLDVTATDVPQLTFQSDLTDFFRDCSSLVFNTSIDNWDVSGSEKFDRFFQGCSLFNQPINSWNLSNANSIVSMVRDCSVFNQPLNGWDVANVVNFSGVFLGASAFNQNLSNWNVSSGTNFGNMFNNALAFNNGGDSGINNWNVSSATLLTQMFDNAEAFNQPLGNWAFPNVTSLFAMFARATVFNQPLNSWNVSNITNMSGLFQETAFNQPLNNWSTGNVTTMAAMFNNATSFNQDLSSFDVTSLTDAADMFSNVTLSTSNYDALLIGWEAQAVQNNVTFEGGNSTYTLGGAAETARTNLINDHSWTINDGGGI